jgi:hypothetical protein
MQRSSVSERGVGGSGAALWTGEASEGMVRRVRSVVKSRKNHVPAWSCVHESGIESTTDLCPRAFLSVTLASMSVLDLPKRAVCTVRVLSQLSCLLSFRLAMLFSAWPLHWTHTTGFARKRTQRPLSHGLKPSPRKFRTTTFKKA